MVNGRHIAAARRPRRGQSRWSVLVFLITTCVVVLIVLFRYLEPAARAARNIDPTGRKQLAAISALVLAVVLVVLIAGLILLIRPGRFFFPGRTPPRTRTKYTDAWAEAGRRAEPPPKEDEDEEE